jgi:hypothetical protein
MLTRFEYLRKEEVLKACADAEAAFQKEQEKFLASFSTNPMLTLSRQGMDVAEAQHVFVRLSRLRDIAEHETAQDPADFLVGANRWLERELERLIEFPEWRFTSTSFGHNVFEQYCSANSVSTMLKALSQAEWRSHFRTEQEAEVARWGGQEAYDAMREAVNKRTTRRLALEKMKVTELHGIAKSEDIPYCYRGMPKGELVSQILNWDCPVPECPNPVA